jgi:hypothetical protein
VRFTGKSQCDIIILEVISCIKVVQSQMSNPSTPILQTTLEGIAIFPLLNDVFYGTIGLIGILIFHGICINHIIMKFETKTNFAISNKKYRWVYIHFYLAFIFIALIHIIEIVLWTFYLFALRLFDSGIDVLIFVGSCYTTVGFSGDILPTGWKSLAFFIAFTGLFSLAWTTSIMIGMTDAYKKAWRFRHTRDGSLKS